jgi:hypothetical protein
LCRGAIDIDTYWLLRVKWWSNQLIALKRDRGCVGIRSHCGFLYSYSLTMYSTCRCKCVLSASCWWHEFLWLVRPIHLRWMCSFPHACACKMHVHKVGKQENRLSCTNACNKRILHECECMHGKLTRKSNRQPSSWMMVNLLCSSSTLS